MADVIKTQIIKLDPAGNEDVSATWVPASKPAEGGIGRVTIRKRYPTSGDGIDIDDDGVVTAKVDNDTLKIDEDGVIYSTVAKSDPAVLISAVGEIAEVPTSIGTSDSTLLPITAASTNGEITAKSGKASVAGLVSWVSVNVLITLECADYSDNMYIVPLVVSVNGYDKKYEVDTTEHTTVINYTVSLYNGGNSPMAVAVHAYKDASDDDSANVAMSMNYKISITGV